MEFFSQLVNRMNMYIPIKRDSTMPSALHHWTSDGYTKLSLDAAGLVALADLSTVARRTAFTGTSALLDALVICPGLHKQQEAPDLNGGEYPACAAMTSGYVFRVENQATVLYLQKVGRTGQLTTISVSDPTAGDGKWMRYCRAMYDFHGTGFVSGVAYFAAVSLAITVLLLLAFMGDMWGVAVVGILIFARLINVVIIRRRAAMGWKGEPEPGQQSDLMILVSQDKWIRLRGAVDDVKAITSGEWLREPTFIESSLIAFATLLVYLDAALAGNASKEGKILLLILLFCSVALLGLVNEYTGVFKMYGKTVKVDGPRKVYRRRLELARQLVQETGRSDWAIRLGMLQPRDIEQMEKAKPGRKESDPPKYEEQSKSGGVTTIVEDGPVTL